MPFPGDDDLHISQWEDMMLRRNTEYPLPSGKMTKNILTNPQTIEIWEMFQIREGKIDQVEAVIDSRPLCDEIGSVGQLTTRVR
jgi:hypothetical protein